MSLVPGNALTLALGKQSGKGSAKSTADVKLAYSGGFGPEPTWDTLQPAQTDAQRQLEDMVRVAFSIKGSSEHYLRPDEQHQIAHALLGSTSTTGSTDYTHVTIPTSDGSAPYYTLYRAVDSTVEVTEMVDCQISKVQWTGGAGQALSAQIDWLGLSAILGASDPTGEISTQDILVYPDVTVTYDGSHDGSVQSFQITVDQGRSLFVGDSGTEAFDIVPGQLAVIAQLVMLFQSDAAYREFIGGDTSATAPAVTIPAKSLTVLAEVDANNSVQWDLAAAQVTGYTRAHNTDGSPLLATIELKSKRSATLSDVISITTKNTVATP